MLDCVGYFVDIIMNIQVSNTIRFLGQLRKYSILKENHFGEIGFQFFSW
jgi:hypothetical protein